MIEQVAHAAGTDADQHFDKLRTAHREERHPRFTCDRARQQRFASSRRADQQHAAWNLATQALVLVGRLQELHHFLQVVLGLVHARHIGKGRAGPVFQDHLRPALAEAEDALLPLRSPAADEDEKRYQEDPGQQRDQNIQPQAVIRGLLSHYRNAIGAGGFVIIGISGIG